MSLLSLLLPVSLVSLLSKVSLVSLLPHRHPGEHGHGGAVAGVAQQGARQRAREEGRVVHHQQVDRHQGNGGDVTHLEGGGAQ